MSATPLKMHVQLEKFPYKTPFHITGHTMVDSTVLVVTLEQDAAVGRGEACGVYYRAEVPQSLVRQVEALRPRLEQGIDRASLQALLPCGGARNALDCALWDLEAKLTGRPAWDIAGLCEPRPLLTTFTVSANAPQRMARDALAYRSARAIKLKLTGESIDAERVRAVRAARPDVWLGVDANQGFTRPFLEQLLPALLEARVELIEQPFKVGQEALLDGLEHAIPIAADESLQGLADLAGLAGRFDVINIKLDKCGGLTEGLAIARAAADLGFEVMVGNMIGTSLAMAPSCLVGQLCTIVDLDGPVFLTQDRVPAVDYSNGMISAPRGLWGSP